MSIRIKAILAAGFLMSLGPMAANAALKSFDLDWSGVSYGNTAIAVGTITLDVSVLQNPGSNSSLASPGLVTSFSISVSGASSGNGTWSLVDFGDIRWVTETALDLTQELFGQPTLMDPWGTPGMGAGGDFNLFQEAFGGGGGFAAAAAPGTAPEGTSWFELTTNDGFGDPMLLTSFRPTVIPIPAALPLFGSALALMGFVGWKRKKTA